MAPAFKKLTVWLEGRETRRVTRDLYKLHGNIDVTRAPRTMPGIPVMCWRTSEAIGEHGGWEKALQKSWGLT